VLLAFKAAKKYKIPTKFKKVLDKPKRKGYNGIVNSKGAADDKSVALFFVISTNSIHKGVYDDLNYQSIVHPFDIYAVTYLRR
jgi:hypothetical protein